MSESRHIARNALFSLSGELGGVILVLAQGILVSRYLGDEGFGVVSFVLSLVLLATAFTDLGTSTLATRDIARDYSQANRIMPQVAGLRLILTLVLAGALFAVSGAALPSPDAGPALRIMILILLISPPASYFVLFRAVERLDLAAMIQTGGRAASLAALVVAVWADAGIAGVALSYVAGQVVVVLLIPALMPKAFRPLRVDLNPGRLRRLVTGALPFLGMNLLWEVYFRIDQILIPFLDSMQGNGQYGVAVRIALQFNLFPTAAGALVFPYFSRQAVTGSESLRKAARMMYRHLSVIGMGGLVFVGLLGEGWILLLFGNQFREAAGALLVLMAAVPITMLYSVNTSLLYALDRQNLVLKYLTLGIVLDVILDFLLIPRMGYVGAAAATLATHVVFGALTLGAAHRAVPGMDAWKSLGAPAASAAAAAAAVLLTGAWSFPARLAAGLPVYAAALWISRAVTLDDLRFYSSVLRRDTHPPANPEAPGG